MKKLSIEKSINYSLTTTELSNTIGGAWWVDTALAAVGYAVGYVAKEAYAFYQSDEGQDTMDRCREDYSNSMM